MTARTVVVGWVAEFPNSECAMTAQWTVTILDITEFRNPSPCNEGGVGFKEPIIETVVWSPRAPAVFVTGDSLRTDGLSSRIRALEFYPSD